MANRRRWLSRFGQLLAQYEKVLLAVLSVVIVVSGTFWFRQLSASQDGPTAGGSYVEGIVGDQAEVQQVAVRLTKTGLFSFDAQGQLVNQLVTDWQANADKTSYTFTLNNTVDKQEMVDDLTQAIDIVGPLTAELNDQGQLVVTLPTGNPSLPVLLAQPIFNYGPYKMSKLSNQTAIFTRNTRTGAKSAFINKIIIHSYKTEADLTTALQRGKVDAAVADDQTTAPSGYHQETLTVHRYFAVLFNTNKAPFRDSSLRSQLVANQPVKNASFTLTVADKEPYQTLAKDLVAKWQTDGAQVTLETKPFDEVRDKVAPSRNFQALLTGLDYGAENDPYYLWHSSQLRPPGNNLTGVKSDKVDQLISQIEQVYNLANRAQLVDQLNQELQQESVAIFLKQASVSMIINDNIRFNQPWLMETADDHFLAVSDWSVK